MNEQPLDPKQNLYLVERDGGTATIDTHELQKFKDEAMTIAKSAAWNVNERRIQSEETRYNLREGKSRDGRKHADANDGKPAFPFEGASDADIRLADMIVNERVLVLMAAAMRHQPEVKSLDIADAALGGKLTKILSWVIENRLGGQYLREMIKLLQYQEADSPAGAVLGVWWDQETALEMKTLTMEEIVQTLVQTYGMDEQHFAQLDVMLQNPDKDSETAEALQQIVPTLSTARARDVVKQLRETGQAEFPSPYLRVDQPVFCAYRLFEDIFFPTNTSDPQRCRVYFLREWLGEAELRERIVSSGYDEKFVDEVLKHETQTMFPLYRRNPGLGDFSVTREEETASKEARRGLFEIVTPVFKAVNADHIPGIYYLPMHGEVDFPAHDRKLLEYTHGCYPFVYFSREILGSRLLDSRGVPELVSTEQNNMKLLADSFNDHVQLMTLPPIKVPRRRTKLSLVLGPLKVIKEDRPGDITYMEGAQYPLGNEKQQEEIRRRVDEYWGRISEKIPPVLTQLHQLGSTTLFLANLTDAFTQLLQLCQQYISDEELAMIAGEDNIPVARSREEIQGKFKVSVTFDPRDLDMGYLKEVAEIIINLVSKLDRDASVKYTALLQRLVTAISPRLAADTIMPADEASKNEEADEENNFTKIAAGVEPAMVEGGQNFPLRLQVLMGIGQKNPEAFRSLNPVSREILQARVKYLQNQVQQIKNAQIGRQVGQPVLGDGGTNGAGMQGISMIGAGDQ